MNWQSVGSEAVELLRALVRIDTSNPPGNEIQAARLLSDSLADDGIASRLLESSESRGNVVARLKGVGQSQGLLLHSHLDVVSAQGQPWSHDPFGAEIHEGFIWGRGTLDMKHMAAMSVMVLKLIKRNNLSLKQDLLFAGTAGEETGGEEGAGFLVKEHPELVRADYMLGEVGGINLLVGGSDIVAIQVAEKGRCLLRLKAAGRAGHGSMPIHDSALVRLGEAIARLGRTRLPQHTTEPARAFIEGVAATQPLPRRLALLQLTRPRMSSLVLNKAIRDPRQRGAFWAMLSNTATPTMVRAGEKENVVPAQAEALVDGRVLPGQTAEDLVREVSKVVGPGIDIEVMSDTRPIETHPMESPLFQICKRAILRNAPSATVVPQLTPGYTDAKHFSKLGIRAYGFTPVWFDPSMGVAYHQLFHAPDERIPVEGFKWGLRVLYEAVEEYCCAS